jgi:hypothetical protein
MLKTTLWLSLFAVCICWAIGAYNRMVRLRVIASEARSLWQTASDLSQNTQKTGANTEVIMSAEQQEMALQLQVKSQLTKDAYLSATEIYNQAIQQFPASLLAATFSFKPLAHDDNKIL